MRRWSTMRWFALTGLIAFTTVNAYLIGEWLMVGLHLASWGLVLGFIYWKERL